MHDEIQQSLPPNSESLEDGLKHCHVQAVGLFFFMHLLRVFRLGAVPSRMLG